MSEPCWAVTSANPKKAQGNERQCRGRPGEKPKSLHSESELAQLTRTGLGKEGVQVTEKHLKLRLSWLKND